MTLLPADTFLVANFSDSSISGGRHTDLCKGGAKETYNDILELKKKHLNASVCQHSIVLDMCLRVQAFF
jgi:hypothetical protein